MKKAFKFTCILLSLIIVVASVGMVFAVAKTGSSSRIFDFLGCNDIVENIKNMEMNMTSVIYVKNTEGEWEEYQRIHGDENRIWVSIDKIPENLINAFIAIEDQRFYQHDGVDWKRTGAAFINWLPHVNILQGNQGGSTITQQLIKNLTSDKEQDASRKMREIMRALMIEQMLDKDTILEAYLNTINLGGRNCGVQVAANYYFNKDVSELSLAECACIAAITKNPSLYKPDINPEENAKRRRLVLDEMLEQKKISYEEYSKAYDEEITIDKTQQSKFEIPVNSYFVETLIDNVTEDLAEKYNCSSEVATTKLYNGGYKIYATLDTRIQGIIDGVYNNISTYFSQKSPSDKSKHLESAVTIMDYQGHIVGIAGGTGEKTVNRGLNRAYNIARQPGSTMKPLGVYAPAIDTGIITYNSRIVDKPLDKYYPDGTKGPKEWYGYYAGTMTLTKAIERSANTIPCHILKTLGVDTSYKFLTETLHMSHLTEEDKNLASLALGGCTYGITPTESAAAYAIFGNGGKYYKPVTYYKVERANGELVLNADIDGEQAIKSATATIMNKLLQNVVYGSQGTGRGIRSYSSMKAYAKTGTSSESNDLWMVAGSPYYVASVWCGFDKPAKVSNSAAAANVWKAIMTEVHKGLENKEFVDSSEVVSAKACKYTGLPAGDKCYSTEDGLFVPGTVQTCNGKHTGLSTGVSTSSSSSSSSKPASSTASSEASIPSSSSVPTTPSTPSTPEEPTTPPETTAPDGSEAPEPDEED